MIRFKPGFHTKNLQGAGVDTGQNLNKLTTEGVSSGQFGEYSPFKMLRCGSPK